MKYRVWEFWAENGEKCFIKRQGIILIKRRFTNPTLKGGVCIQIIIYELL
jgi:hypothetical protein